MYIIHTPPPAAASTYPHGLVAAVGFSNKTQVGLVNGLASCIVVFVTWDCAKHHAVECGEEMVWAGLCCINVGLDTVQVGKGPGVRRDCVGGDGM